MRHLLKIIRALLIRLIRFTSKVFNILKLWYWEVDYKKKPILKGLLRIQNYGVFKIGENVKITSNYLINPIGGNTFSSFKIYEGGVLIIKDEAGLSNVAICCRTKIVIGERVLIGGGVCIYDTDFHSTSKKLRMMSEDKGKTKEVNICDDAFIGAQSLILKGVIIGKGSIVAARSVVTKSIPSGELWGGNPAVYISSLEREK